MALTAEKRKIGRIPSSWRGEAKKLKFSQKKSELKKMKTRQKSKLCRKNRQNSNRKVKIVLNHAEKCSFSSAEIPPVLLRAHPLSLYMSGGHPTEKLRNGSTESKAGNQPAHDGDFL